MDKKKSETIVGWMPMPANFQYRSLFLQGRPQHKKYDDFWRKHPPMDTVHRAKIFAPFDALAGFNECVNSKNVVYQPRRCLSEGEKEDLDQKLNLLRSLTINSRVARENRPQVTIEYYSPCSDPNSEAFGHGGVYKTVAGICWKVDDVHKTVTIDEEIYQIEDISTISGDLFEALENDIP